jgi:Lrp/AsnC family leucine-responsive transcriptional regulator/Lrp/AsnC family transcriptional regulator
MSSTPLPISLATLDDIDLRLLRLLQQDASRTTKELAAELGLSITPVHERMKRLERDEVITGYVALVNRQKLGKSLMAICTISLREHSRTVIEQFDRSIKKLPEVLECYNIAGQHDYVLKIVLRDMQEYQAFMLKLADVKAIATTQTSFVLREIKNSNAVELP